jgi:hypothetical protein
MRPVALLRWIPAVLVALCALLPLTAEAQPRFYWKSLDGANVVPLIFETMSGNANPADPAHTAVPGANVTGTLGIAGYSRMFSLFDRGAMAALIVPMGHISGEVSTPLGTTFQSANGFGDPMLEFDINLIGPRAQKNLADIERYEPGFSLDFLADFAFPIGQYSSSQPLNLGQNRWYGRLGAPVIWQLGPWIPGKRTTLEFLPAVWLFGDNTDYLGGQTLKTDPLFQLDAHITRDFTDRFWGAIDGVWYSGGRASLNGVQGSKLNNIGLGLTLGYSINDNINMTFGYKSTVNDSAPTDLRMDGFQITLVFGWHPLIEGSKRLKSE